MCEKTLSPLKLDNPFPSVVFCVGAGWRCLVAQGNEQLVQATQRTFSFRIFVLCFLIGASFVLLFLDWYNP